MYIIEGQIESVSRELTYNKKDNKKIEVVLLTKNELVRDRLEFIKVEFMNDQIDLIQEKNFEVGDKVKITFQLVGRKFTKEDQAPRYFGNIQGIAIEYL